jgi:hypothetical protein
MTGRRGRRRGQLLDDFKGRPGYCKLKEDVLDPRLWRTDFGKGYGSVVRLRNNESKPEELDRHNNRPVAGSARVMVRITAEADTQNAQACVRVWSHICIS